MNFEILHCFLLFFCSHCNPFAPQEMDLLNCSKQTNSVIFQHQEHNNEVNRSQVFFCALLRGKFKTVLQIIPHNYSGDDEHP